MTVTVFQGAGVHVTFDTGLCKHHGACVRAQPKVFDVSRTPWIEPDQASVEQVLDAVSQCPTGALKAVRHVAGPAVDVGALEEFIGKVRTDPSAGALTFRVMTTWQGGTASTARTGPVTLGSESLTRSFTINADEPRELLGEDSAPNPQELLLAALNACMTVGYVANAAALGVPLKGLSIRTTGTLDLRGFLGLDAEVNPGYDEVSYQVDIVSDAPPADIEAIHRHVQRTSPNFHNFARAIRMRSELRIESERK